MKQRCEVCQNFRPQGDERPDRPLDYVSYGDRRVLLCRAHAGIAHNSGVTTFEGLRELYSESHGGRSYVPRRAAGNLARSPSSAGRRAGDSA